MGQFFSGKRTHSGDRLLWSFYILHNQVQLAEYFGVTRPALSKEINKLVDSGFIRISRNKVKILNKQALISML